MASIYKGLTHLGHLHNIFYFELGSLAGSKLDANMPCTHHRDNNYFDIQWHD